MNFMQWLNSLDELLYEIVSWIVFFPVTLWKALRRPLGIMDYADTELADAIEDQYTETLSPPVFLVLALVVAHALEVAVMGGTNPVVQSRHGLAAFVNDNTSLLLVRVVIFSAFPLMMATRMAQLTGGLSRETLKPPFYAQCFTAAPLALIISVGGLISQLHLPILRILGLSVVGGAVVGYGLIQTLWFRRRLGQSLLCAFGNASIGMVLSVAVAIGTAYLFVF